MTNLHKETCAVVRSKKDDRLLLHQTRRPRLTKGENNLQKQAMKEALQTKGAKFRAVTFFFLKKKKTFCRFWHPPVCHNYKSETGCIHGKNCFFRHVDENPSKKSKTGGAKGSVALLKESTQLGREEGNLGSKRAVKFSKGTWHQIKIWERKSPSRGTIQKCEPHERSPCPPKFGERSHEETLHQERCARRVASDLAKKIYKLKNADKATFYIPIG